MKILIAVEDKIYGKAMTDFVVEHQWSGDVSFKVVHVDEPLSFARKHDGFSKEQLDAYVEERKRLSKSLVMGIGTTLHLTFPPSQVEEIVAEGHAKEVILDMASEWGADLIVMGSHGRRGLQKFFLGSVSQAVLAHSPCSVAIIRLPAATEKETAAATDAENKEPVSTQAMAAG